jgi:hypothetical protein
MDIWVVYTFELLEIKMLCTFVSKYLGDISFYLGWQTPEKNILVCIVNLTF